MTDWRVFFLHFAVLVTIGMTQEGGVIGFTVLFAFDDRDVHGRGCISLVSTNEMGDIVFFIVVE